MAVLATSGFPWVSSMKQLQFPAVDSSGSVDLFHRQHIGILKLLAKLCRPPVIGRIAPTRIGSVLTASFRWLRFLRGAAPSHDH